MRPLVCYPEHCGGLSNVATVLQELAEHLDGGELVRVAEADDEVAYAQRLGYLLDRVGRQEVARALAEWVDARSPRVTPLSPGPPITGPSAMRAGTWHRFWEGKLRTISWQGVHVYSRALRYRNKTVKLPDGKTHTFLAGEEKGIDVRIALDVIRVAHRNEYDIALVLSQDQDLSEVAAEIRAIAREQNRWIKIACAFPSSPTSRSRRGIEKTDWIRIDRTTYDACLDRRDYRRGIEG